MLTYLKLMQTTDLSTIIILVYTHSLQLHILILCKVMASQIFHGLSYGPMRDWNLVSAVYGKIKIKKVTYIIKSKYYTSCLISTRSELSAQVRRNVFVGNATQWSCIATVYKFTNTSKLTGVLILSICDSANDTSSNHLFNSRHKHAYEVPYFWQATIERKCNTSWTLFFFHNSVAIFSLAPIWNVVV